MARTKASGQTAARPAAPAPARAAAVDPLSCRIFLGPELGEKQAAIDDVEKRLAGTAPAALERTTWYAGEMAAQDMVAALRNGALFAETRLFIVKNAEAIKKKDDVELFAAYLRAPAEMTTVIFVSEENSIAADLEKAAPVGSKKVFYELFEDKKTEWVGNFFRRRGFRVGAEAIAAVLELVENNTQALERDCSRLTLFLDKGREVRPEDVERWLAHTREESAFTLFSRIAAGDFSRSLESLRALLGAKEPPQVILAGLAWCFRKLRDGLNAAGSGEGDPWKRVGVYSPQARRDYAAASRRFDAAAADRCLALTAEYDALIRSTSSFPALPLMDRYLYRIHALGRAGRRP